MLYALSIILGAALGAGIFFVVQYISGRNLREMARQEAEGILDQAKQEARQLREKGEIDAKAEYVKRSEQFEKEAAESRNELREAERRLAKREDNMERKSDALTTKERALDTTSKRLAEREKAIAVKEHQLSDSLAQQRAELLKIASMTVDEARELLLSRLEREVEKESSELISKRFEAAKETANVKAREIIVTAIQRYAAEHTSDSTVSTVDIPSDEMKGRVIGREGRNIRAFEKATGVDVIVDDTPGVVVISSFDPVRREVARRALEKLIQDGRIHPGRIEEIVGETAHEVDEEVTEIGKKAALEANVLNLHPKIYELLGRLNFRTSYGQNVLRHSIEVAYLCQMMADELGLDGTVARRCGLLHDIGKAVDHEVEGGHPYIGAELAKRYNEKSEVLNAISAHHGDGEATTIYTPLVAAADAISASRPGARRESLERYVKRLEQLEGLATSFNGVRQAFAIQAGREIRVIVDASEVDDQNTLKMAREMARKIEDEMEYPGEIKVTLLREVRATEYAR
ncbi:MAG: ribonuclease Y [Phycisphaerae bacterium]|nr:ribonuclease Y [Phycisphaerae bacterium]